MNKIVLVLCIMLLMTSAACTAQTPKTQPQTQFESPEPTTLPTTNPTLPLTTLQIAEFIIQAIDAKDLARIADFVHPEMGVRFSPYATIRQDHLVFSADDLPGLFSSNRVYRWGYYDGSGEAIELTFVEYYNEFIYTAKFANSEEVALNMRIGQGNTLNNIQDFYPESDFVEYHFTGFEAQFAGMDWQSLRLVFIEEGGVHYLVAIVHDQWTI